MREDQLQEKILDLCKWLHLKVFHVYDSRKSAGPGYPDLTIVGKNGVIFAELKSDKGRVSLAQTEWLEALDVAGAATRIWRPEDWPKIQKDLTELSGAKWR